MQCQPSGLLRSCTFFHKPAVSTKNTTIAIRDTPRAVQCVVSRSSYYPVEAEAEAKVETTVEGVAEAAVEAEAEAEQVEVKVEGEAEVVAEAETDANAEAQQALPEADNKLPLPAPTEPQSPSLPQAEELPPPTASVEPQPQPQPQAEAVPLPALPTSSEELHLVKPENVKSRFWVHFLRYNTAFHPDKKTTARCSLCGKEISVKQGTGGLKNHLKFKHPEENRALFESEESYHAAMGSPGAMMNYRASSSGASSRSKSAASRHLSKKHRFENAYVDATIRLDAEKRLREKHWMEMWTILRKELRELRKEMRDEEDAATLRELEGDARFLRKRKAEFEDMLGIQNPAEDVEV
eukprot:CAMPEP_0183709592 /NCGR_PEP_ID=MMETSP0737-20130205/5601_1 /TAXON_ID=385413 /ORGANISM="Thalassiosira miniscula, Strain CCMP1093" /LENGTH=351 /DNA_ID=CAMNT_0025937729 /DNA_START=234 /DNA_END=1290 /DNA_ORIENTATION=-